MTVYKLKAAYHFLGFHLLVSFRRLSYTPLFHRPVDDAPDFNSRTRSQERLPLPPFIVWISVRSRTCLSRGGSENMDEKFETKTDVRGTELKIYRDRII